MKWVLFVFPTFALICALVWTVADAIVPSQMWQKDMPDCIFGIVMAVSFWIVALAGYGVAIREK